MSLLCDREIRRLCVPPTYLLYDRLDEEAPPLPVSPPYSPYEYKLIADLNGRASGQQDQSLRHYLRKVNEPLIDFQGMLTPFSSTLVRQVDDEKVISYGLSSYGYDVTIAPEFKVASNLTEGILDPKALDERKFVDHVGDHVVIPPMSFVLTRTKEYFRMPRDVTGLVLTKSTYARIGLVCVTTVIEAGWHGELVLEYFNSTPVPAKLYAHEGGAQILFLKGEQCDTPYDETRKYQGQRGITLPRT